MNKIIIIAIVLFSSCSNSPKKTGGIESSDTSGTYKDSTPAVTSSITGLNVKDTSQLFELLKVFERSLQNIKKDTFELPGMSAEGGELIIGQDISLNMIKYSGSLFGETGRSEFEFYVNTNKKLQLAHFAEIKYDKPIAVEGSKEISRKETYQLYVNDSLVAVLDENRQPLKKSAKELAQIKKDAEARLAEYLDNKQKPSDQ